MKIMWFSIQLGDIQLIRITHIELFDAQTATKCISPIVTSSPPNTSAIPEQPPNAKYLFLKIQQLPIDKSKRICYHESAVGIGVSSAFIKLNLN